MPLHAIRPMQERMDRIDVPFLVRFFRAAAARLDAHRDELCRLDGEIGDGDHGSSMADGFAAVAALGRGDRVISLAILRHVAASAEERQAYLRYASAMRRASGAELSAEEAPTAGADAEEATAEVELGQERYADMGAQEQFVLTLTENGYGKRSSAYEYRVTGRGGKGITAMVTNARNGALVSSFPVEGHDQVMLITDRGQTIRVPVEGIRIAGRATQGVIVFDTAEGEHVVSVEHIAGGAESEVAASEAGEESGGDTGNGEPGPGPDETPPET